MLVRSVNGIVSLVQSGGAFVDPNTLTDRGYPAYTDSQKKAYQYISANSARNPDIRSLYTDPAVPWASIQYQVETMGSPPASSNISAADFQFVKKQTIDELTAIQSVNLMYGATGQILTNTYLVKDATLEEVTDVLGLPSNPDITGPVLNDLTTALGGLGTALSAAGSIIQLTKDAAKLASIINQIQAAGSLAYLLSGITGDTATYTAQTPPDIATGKYSLKTSLDNLALGAATSNACNQLASLSAWNQSKPLADGVLSGAIPLDLETQQDFLVAGQAIFQMNVWQTLAPSKWSYYSVMNSKTFDCKNCLFQGDPNYPVQDSVEAQAAHCVTQPDNVRVSLLLGDPSTHNYPNISALNALFSPPPAGIGVYPADVFFGQNGWSIPYGGVDVSFLFNTGYATLSCSGGFTASTTLSNPECANWRSVGFFDERLAGCGRI